MKYRSVFLAVWMRDLLQFTRYLFNTVSGLVTLYVVFLFIFYGVRALGGPAVSGGDLETVIVGYFLWSQAIFTYSDLSWGLSSEAQVGTLEQLYLCPAGFSFVNACSTVANLAFNTIMNLVLLLAAMATTGKWLKLDALSIVPLLLLSMAGVYGIGFIMGGLALVFKRIQAAFQIMQFVFVGFLIAPLGRFPAARYLPLATGNMLIQKVMVDGKRLWELPLGDVGVLVGTGAFYCALGLAVFSYCVKVARERGLLGQY